MINRFAADMLRYVVLILLILEHTTSRLEGVSMVCKTDLKSVSTAFEVSGVGAEQDPSLIG